MDLRPFRPADLDRLLELTIATFGPFYEPSFRGIVGDTVMANQHGNWREDYHNQWQSLLDPDNGKYVLVAEDHGEIVGFIAWTSVRRSAAVRSRCWPSSQPIDVTMSPPPCARTSSTT
jgi:hypothetical protein